MIIRKKFGNQKESAFKRNEKTLLGSFKVKKKIENVSKSYELNVYSVFPTLSVFDDLRNETLNYASSFEVSVDVYEVEENGAKKEIVSGERAIFSLLFLEEGLKKKFDLDEGVLWSHVKKEDGPFFASLFEEEVIPALILPEESELRKVFQTNRNVVFLPLEKGLEVFYAQFFLSTKYLANLKKVIESNLKELTRSVFVKSESEKEKKAKETKDVFLACFEDFFGEEGYSRYFTIRDLLKVYLEVYGKPLQRVLQDEEVKSLEELKEKCVYGLKKIEALVKKDLDRIERKCVLPVLRLEKTLFPNEKNQKLTKLASDRPRLQ